MLTAKRDEPLGGRQPWLRSFAVGTALLDRRFYRQKYDAQQVMARFAAMARDETDKQELALAIAAVLRETLQPEQVTLWLGPEEERV